MTLMGKLICNNIHNAIGFKTVIADSKANQCITRNFKKEHSKIRQLGGGGQAAPNTKHQNKKNPPHQIPPKNAIQKAKCLQAVRKLFKTTRILK